jgi:DNA polymerase-1
MFEKKSSIMIIDAMSLFIRHYVANPTMSDSGEHVGGTIGFLRSIEKLSQKIRPEAIIIAWEGGGAPRRRAIFKNYKSGRRPQRLNRFYEDDLPNTSENRDYQVALTIEILKNLPVNQIYVPDCEADDVIGYLIRHRFLHDKCVIVSSDKDLYQLVSENVIQWSPGQKKFIDCDEIKEKFGVSSRNMCVTRCFCGDPSDSIDGIKGAGFKTMSKRFPELALDKDVSVDDIVNHSREMLGKSKVKLYGNIVENIDILRRNWKLMYLSSQNLSAYQIQKINSILENMPASRDKMSVIRIMLREGINKFDMDSFFMSIVSVVR